MVLLGIGFGVLAGSALETIALQEKDNQMLLPSWLSFKRVFVGSGMNSKVNKMKNEAKKDFDNNLIIEGSEITSLSQKWQDIANQERDLIASGFLLNLEDKRFAKLKPDTTLSAASSIKIPILLVTLKLVDSGQLRWDEALKLSQDVIGSEAGWMAYQKLGTLFPVYEVATEMIRISDNTATNLLIQRIGGIKNLNDHFKALGLQSTVINNFLPDMAGTNTTSAYDLARTIAMVDTGQVLSPRTRDLFREVMSTSISNRLLPGGFLKGLGIEKEDVDHNLLINGYRIYNKTGDIGIAYADAGLIQMPDNTRAVAGFIVKGPFNDPRSSELIRKLAAAMVPVLKPPNFSN